MQPQVGQLVLMAGILPRMLLIPFVPAPASRPSCGDRGGDRHALADADHRLTGPLLRRRHTLAPSLKKGIPAAAHSPRSWRTRSGCRPRPGTDLAVGDNLVERPPWRSVDRDRQAATVDRVIAPREVSNWPPAQGTCVGPYLVEQGSKLRGTSSSFCVALSHQSLSERGRQIFRGGSLDSFSQGRGGRNG